MVISNSLRASRLGRIIPILPVPLPENTYRVVVKWRLRVLLDQHRDHTHRILLRHFLQGHVEDTVNADLDSLLDVMFRRLESVNSSTFIKKKGGKKIGWHALVIDHSNVKFARSFVDEVWPSNQCDRIKHLNIFLQKVADAMKTVHLIIDDDFMLQIEGTLSSKIFLLNLSFLPDQFFGTKDCPFLDLGFKQILGQLRNDEATNSLIKNTFGSKTILCRDCYRQMTGKVMSLIAYGAFTDKMVISNTLLSNNIDMFWKTLSMVIPGSVLQSLVSDATYVRKSMPHTCTLLHTAVNHSNVSQEPHFDYQQAELVVNDFEKCLPWGLDMSLGAGGFSINVWDGESFESNLILDRKGTGKAEFKQHAMEHVNQHAMLLRIPFKYIFLMRGDTVHAGAMDNHLSNGALRLHMYLSPGSTPEQNSVAICKRFGNAINTKANGTERIPPSLVSFLLDSYGERWK